jgi:hypothetical protein
MTSSGMLRRVALVSVRLLLVTASIVPSSSILVTLIIQAPSSSETSDLTRATWRNIPEDGILQAPIQKETFSILARETDKYNDIYN